MGTLTERFPADISAGADGGHGHFQTRIVVGAGGYEDRNSEWEDARGRWNVGRAIEQTGKHEVARNHFYKARGAFHSFRFKDWHDFKASRTGNAKGRLTGGGTAWQLNKVYGADEVTYEYVRPIKRVVALSESIWRNAALQTRGADYTINIDTGAITAAVSWTGATLEAQFEFDVLCRYEVDEFTARLVHRRNESVSFFDWSRIGIIEVRE